MEQLGLIEPFKPLKNTLICSYRHYQKFKEPWVALSLKFTVADLDGLNIYSDYSCPENTAYLFDRDGRMHTILVRGQATQPFTIWEN